MKVDRLVCAIALAVIMPACALADDPNDPTMRSAAAKTHDHEMIRQLNRQELASVQERDARYAEGWRNWHVARSDATTTSDYAARSREYEHNMANYADERARYEMRLAQWRRAVEACRAGDYSACQN